MKITLANQMFILLIIFILFGACNTAKKPYYNERVMNWEEKVLPSDIALRQTVFLIGDAGAPLLEGQEPTLKTLEKQLQEAGENSAVVYLGDNIYPRGLPKKDNPGRPKAEARLNEQLKILEDYKGRPFFVPGNHDWNLWSKGGLKAIEREEKYIEKYLGKEEVMLPSSGCGDPTKVKLDDETILIFIDSQWWLHDWEEEKKINKGCEVKSRLEFVQRFKDLINKNKNKNILVLMHHPIYSNGEHGGHFSAKSHLFPLTAANKSLYIPLPVVGSLVPMYRKFRGSTQDIPHPKYQRLRQELLDAVAPYRNIIFAAGHEHALQYFKENRHHFIVSGSGCKSSFARKGKSAQFVHSAEGFAKLYFYENGDTWVEFMKAVDDGSSSTVIFRKQLIKGEPILEDVISPDLFEDITADSVVKVATTRYQAGGSKRFFLGDQYRNAWAAPVKAPVLRLEKEFGGLYPIQKGGGFSTTSLRLETEDGRQYALRSINKGVDKVLPEFAQKTWAQDLFQDQISAVHPYGAFVIPPLAKAAGIYHTNPRLVYMPKQERLGIYNLELGGQLYLLEERPAKNRSDVASFGKSIDIIGYNELLPKLRKNHNHFIDEDWVLKSRLFDLFVHDWDRHDDQWRWASFDQDDGTTIYRPIPRDRDQVFYTFKGILPWLVSQKFAVPKFQTFKHTIRNVPDQSFNARHFDRAFMSSLELDDWLEEAKQIRASLTDEVIEKALREWPDTLYRLNAPDIIEKLKSRRDQLPEFSEELYRYLAKRVDVVGSDKRELFEVERLDNGNTTVKVFGVDKERNIKRQLYERTFRRKETQEVRLYGLAGDDEFSIKGQANKAILLRVIGGDGDDIINDDSKVSGFGKKTKAYDTTDGVVINSSGEVKPQLAEDFDVNEYDRHQFKYNTYFPLLAFGANFDDGFFFGGGVSWTNYRFRKEPYANKHFFLASYAFKTNAFNVSYKGDFIGAIGKLDFNPEVDFQNPTYINHFGLGNTTMDADPNTRFNWVRMARYSIKPYIKKSWQDGRFQIRFGPAWENAKVVQVDDEPRIAEVPRFTESELAPKNYLGGAVELGINSVDNTRFAKDGFQLGLKASYTNNLTDKNHFGRLEAFLSTFFTFNLPLETTLGNRIGVATMIGQEDQYLFYHNNTLGGNNFLRGFRRDRFAGKTVFYHNIDLRVHLFYFKNRLMPMDVGLIGSFDYGRVWQPGETGDNVNNMHYGYSAGLWFTPFTLAAVNVFYTFTESTEDDLFTLRLGFFF